MRMPLRPKAGLFMAMLSLPLCLANLRFTRAAIPTNMTIDAVVGLWTLPSGGCEAAIAALKGMSIPFVVNTISTTKVNKADLKNADGSGKYNSVVICSQKLYYIDSGGVQVSGFPDEEWLVFEQYEQKFGVRRVTFGVWPGPIEGVNWPPGSCCGDGVEQMISIAPSAYTLANFTGINPTGKFSTQGLSHYPTTLYTGQVFDGFGTATPILNLEPSGSFDSNSKWIGGVVTNYANTGRQEMNFFMAFGSWSPTSMVIQHLWIQWALRSTYPGIRRTILINQVDDVFLPTDATVNTTAPVPESQVASKKNGIIERRITPQDVAIHQTWQTAFNKKLPAGSSYKLELIYNGNGVVQKADPENAVYTTDFPEIPNSLGFVKPLGTGTNNWPANTTWKWNQTTLLKDPLYKHFVQASGAKSSFFWVSHTFTHMELNNATYSDTGNEILFNRIMANATYLNLDKQSYYSPSSLVPPAITGLFNGDALKALNDNGIKAVCGDNTRSNLVNSASPFYALKSTSAVNGYNGMIIIPRFATNIYYNVSDFKEAEYLYNVIYFGQFPRYSSWKDIYEREQKRVSLQLLSLRPDAYMFHQANMRSADITEAVQPYFPAGKFSLLMLWAEMIATEYSKYVTWPLLSYSMDTMVKYYQDRETRESCGVTIKNRFSNGMLVGIDVRGGTKISCVWPVSLPGSFIKTSDNNWWRTEKKGEDPLTVWVPSYPYTTQSLVLDPPVKWM